MLRSILDLGDVWVEEIMIHRKDVGAIDVDQPPAKIVEEVLSSPFTRMPLWQEDPDTIVGVLHAKALLRAVQEVGNAPDTLDIHRKSDLTGQSVSVRVAVGCRRYEKK